MHMLGKRFSNGAEINTRNILDMSGSGLATKKDWKLLEELKENNSKRNLKRRCNERDRYS